MNLKEIIAKKDIIISIEEKIKLIKTGKHKIENKKSFIKEFFKCLKKCFFIIFIFLLCISISAFNYFFISKLFGENIISALLSNVFTIIIMCLPSIIKEKRVENKIKKILNKKEGYKIKLYKYFKNNITNLTENITEELEDISNFFNEEEIKLISKKENENLIYINKETFEEEAYNYIKNNELTKEEYLGLLILLDKMDIEIDKEKLEDTFELSKIKNMSIKTNKFLVSI